HKAEEIKQLNRRIRQDFPLEQELVHVCVYAAPFGVVPLELDEVYPLSQHEIATPVDLETVGYVAERVRDYLASSSYKKIVLVEDAAWKGRVSSACNRLKRKGLSITVLSVREKLNDKVLNDFMSTLRKLVT
ncbi:MAG: DUF5591 domain-containing protein, partial [Candidatus Bathyarchaeota archaeon]|nr:DUF5591 domain-containing protein [Candidatus Bathyarchaeota archaeon]